MMCVDIVGTSLSSQSSVSQRARGRAGEAKRVQQLEHQVRELEEVIRRRFPNSLSALILTSGAATQKKGETYVRCPTDCCIQGWSDNYNVAIILTVCSGDGTREGVSGGVEAPPSSSHQKLQNRIRQLEHDLECREEESSKRIRALQQKYSNMEVRRGGDGGKNGTREDEGGWREG